MKKKILILFFLPFFCLAQNKDYKNFDKALKYSEQGNLEKAVKYANKALKNNPDWNQPNLLLASIYANNNQIELAADYLLKVYDVDNRDDFKGIEQIFNLYYSNGFYDKALFFADKLAHFNNNKFRISKDIDRKVKNCKFAIKSIKNPFDFNPINLGKNINSNYEEYLPAISVDGKKLVFSRRYFKGNFLQEDFFISEKSQTGSWSVSIPYDNNLNTDGNEGAFSFSPNTEKVIYTACDRLDGLGRCDLYLYVDGKIFNAGETLNSKEWDSQGCFSPDGKYLYFVSTREGGYGGKDIWRSEIFNNTFLDPENMGPIINTKFDEMSPFLHPDNLTLYFASNGHLGMGDYDIYVSRRKDALQNWDLPINIGYPINTHNTENSLIVANDGKTAYYSSNKSGYGLEDIFVFDLPQDFQAKEVSEIEMAIITQKEEEIILRNVMFSSNSYEIEESSFNELNDLVDYLNKNPDISLHIQGHTDNIGSDYENLILSENRARVIFEYLASNSSNKLTYKGYGERKPIADNETVEGRFLNRRTSFTIF